MAKIEKHISELLHDNDCVIVPKMGGFLSSQPFSGNHTFKLSSGTFSKKISFNVLLNYNDGLLANHMVKHSKLSYDEALLEIEKFVDEIHHVTDSGGKFKIDQVGILYKDAERNIQIEPFMNLDHPTDPPVNSDPKPFSAATETKQADIINPKTLFISHPLIINKKKSSIFRKTKFIFLVFLIAAGIVYIHQWFALDKRKQKIYCPCL